MWLTTTPARALVGSATGAAETAISPIAESIARIIAPLERAPHASQRLWVLSQRTKHTLPTIRQL